MWFAETLPANVVIPMNAHYLDVDQLEIAGSVFSTSFTSRGPITEHCVERGGRAPVQNHFLLLQPASRQVNYRMYGNVPFKTSKTRVHSLPAISRNY